MGKHALLIANSKYGDERLNSLNAPSEDVVALKGVLDDQHICSFDSAEAVTNAPLEQIQRQLKGFLSNRDREDLILVYYTGHGLLDSDGKLWLALSGSSAEAPEVGSLEGEYLRRQLDKCSSRRQVLILDCCHSGALVEDAAGGMVRAKDGPLRPAIVKKTFDPEGYGRFVLASSSSTQRSYEIGKRSIYTKSLVEGLKEGKAAPEKDKISVLDLASFAEKSLKDANSSMRPLVSWDRQELGDLILARNPRPRRSLPGDLIKALNDKSSKEKRRGAVDLIIDFALNQNDEPRLRDEAISVLTKRLNAEENVAVHRALDTALKRLSGSDASAIPCPVADIPRSGGDNRLAPKVPVSRKKLIWTVSALLVLAAIAVGAGFHFMRPQGPASRIVKTAEDYAVLQSIQDSGARAILDKALGEIGTPGGSRIIAYFDAAGPTGPIELKKWRGAFLAWVVRQAGFTPPNNPAWMANWIGWGEEVSGAILPAGAIATYPFADAASGYLSGVVLKAQPDCTEIIVGNWEGRVAVLCLPGAPVSAGLPGPGVPSADNRP